jgi:cysteine desulfurase
VGAKSVEIYFNSGATEGNNLVLKGVAAAKPHGRILSCVTEHTSVLDTLCCLKKAGYAVTTLPVNRSGHIDLSELRAEIDRSDLPPVVMVSLMGANNEIGTIHPISEIGQITRERQILLHVDGAQIAGKMLIDVNSWTVDFLCLSAHKMYGPKGIGAIYIRKGLCESALLPLLHGGGQERGMRPGTLPVPLVVAMGEAARLASEDLQHECVEIRNLRDQLWAGLSVIGGVRVNGDISARLPGNLSVTFDEVVGDEMIAELADIAVSSTSACSAGSGHPSHVLQAIGLSECAAKSTLRFGIGRFNTDAEIQQVIAKFGQMIPRLRSRFRSNLDAATSIGKGQRLARL